MDRYSRMVGLLKVLLPLVALAILSTLFLLSRVIDPEPVIPFADKEIQDRLRDQQVTGPIYHGTTAGGDEIAFAAARLITVPGQAGSNEAEEVHVTMNFVSGQLVQITANLGHMDVAENRADLEGDVVITTSQGYIIESDKLIAELSNPDVLSPGAIKATGPIGTLDAGSMHLIAANNGSDGQLVFTNGVKLVYDPRQNQK
ncbi:MAG: LPS export ABC transporter periplasmic protein LptC [Pseudomonadota bacterium]